ncbi:unnamed protein product [Bursaphelenchus okinawaensis]|uniref:Pyridoxal kinase n=1 Tax=Bursaphelenchus okinawaensis TaxID=465554 RepID=A0A811LR95_9BILA|nr:unnamed protein product [Bursaphelenchus okinawaensis]CAG9127318.1 unnamed protein product [Bursaphelenchus okinawaensis]
MENFVAVMTDRLKLTRPNKRVLTIQSHVVSGYAGNKSAVFPLQLHGFETDIMNSVQFSNHTAYKNGVRGKRFHSDDIKELIEGLKLNSLDEYSHILTGYCGDPAFLNEIGNFLKEQKQKNPDLFFVCDPVLGDDGVGYYTPKELMEVYRDNVIQYANILTPNAFELRELSGKDCKTIPDYKEAVKYIHEKYGIPMVVVSSNVPGKADQLTGLTSQKMASGEIEQHLFKVPKLPHSYVGTGDIFASLLLVWIEDTKDLKESVDKALQSVQAVLKRTYEKAHASSDTPTAKEKELQLIESRFDILCPSGHVDFERI